jgi:ADP-ribosylglycohydrolase
LHYNKDRKDLIEKGFKEIHEKVQAKVLNKRGPVGVWTDDCSMALCLADSLLLNNFQLDPIDLRRRFLLWINCGLNNGGRRYSIGLGGNIAVSF